jgi:hypothetical protein
MFILILSAKPEVRSTTAMGKFFKVEEANGIQGAKNGML